jgi:hypothetical protein
MVVMIKKRKRRKEAAKQNKQKGVIVKKKNLQLPEMDKNIDVRADYCRVLERAPTSADVRREALLRDGFRCSSLHTWHTHIKKGDSIKSKNVG